MLFHFYGVRKFHEACVHECVCVCVWLCIISTILTTKSLILFVQIENLEQRKKELDIINKVSQGHFLDCHYLDYGCHVCALTAGVSCVSNYRN